MKKCAMGFTLTELIVGIVVAAIVVLMVGAIGTIAIQSYNDLRQRSNVYNDSQSALQLIRETVRQSTSVPSVSVVNSNNCLTVPVGVVTNYIHGQGTGLVRDLVYGSSCANVGSTLISGVTVTGPAFFLPSVSGQVVTIVLNGTKSGVTFNYTLSTARRNP